jgi:ubiquinone/menaquinone biosynthesis C-methylase UbiE
MLLDSRLRRWIEPPERLVEKLDITSEMTVVDFGCGPGYFTVELAKRAYRVIGVDVQEGMLNRAQRKIQKAGVSNVEFQQSDGKSIQLSDQSVDLIVLFTVFHEVADTKAALKELHRILKAGGRLAIAESIKKSLTGAPQQNPVALQAYVEASDFKLQKMEPYKSYGIFFFTKAPLT